jgi:N-acetylmuramoyl-L-alanine amidase
LDLESYLDWTSRPDSRTSSHYVIGRDGRIVQMVPDEMVAWHAGRSAMRPNDVPPGEVDVNQFSLAITLIGTADSGFTDRQMAATYTLVEALVAKYQIPPTRVVGHEHIAPGRQQDPSGYINQFNWRKMYSVAEASFRTSGARTS